MDETSPAYENFLNQMRKFRRPIRENTRKISASKFLNQPESANIEQIKKLTGSILETLKRQEKFEVEAFLDLQKYLLDLKKKGIVLAICSKNEHATATSAISKHPEMILRLKDFVSVKINWKDNSQ